MKKDRIHYISILSIVSAFAVVFLHANGCFWAYSEKQYWFSANIIECLMYFAVPVFFMISGATLIDYREKYSTKEYFIKRIKKTVIPFLVWSIIGIIFRIIEGWIQIKEVSFKGIFEMILNSECVGIYWFFGALFGIYLCIPVLSAIPQNMRKSIFTYIAVGAFVINSLLPFIGTLINFNYSKLDPEDRIYFGIGIGYLLYVVLGYLLHEYNMSRKMTVIIYILGIIGLFMHLLGTYRLSTQAGEIVETYKGYNNVPCILYSIAVFVFFKNLIIKLSNNKKANSVIIWMDKRLGSYTFSIYLLHWYFMEVAIKLLKLDGFSLIYRLGAPIIIVILCIVITKVIRRIPGMKWLLP